MANIEKVKVAGTSYNIRDASAYHNSTTGAAGSASTGTFVTGVTTAAQTVATGGTAGTAFKGIVGAATQTQAVVGGTTGNASSLSYDAGTTDGHKITA